MSALCKDVQDSLVARLGMRKAAAGYSTLGIVGRRVHVITSDIDAQIKKAGVCVYVFPALPLQVNSNNPGPHIDRLLVRCRAIEHPQLNRSGPDAYELVEWLLRELDGLQLTTVEGLQPFYFEREPVLIIDDDTLVQFDVLAWASCGLVPRTE